MRFSRQAFNRHLNNIGQNVLWLASYACPCVNPHSGAPDAKCPACVGRGRIWEKGVETVVGVPGQKTQERWAKLGMYEVGDLVLSIPENCPMWDRAGQFDRVVSLDAFEPFSEVLTRGAPSEVMRYRVVKFTRCFWRSRTNPAEMVDGGIPTVGENGKLLWTEKEPPASTPYTLVGTRHTEYFMVDGFPSNRNQHSGMRLPKNTVLRKWDLFGRQSRTAPAATYGPASS